MYASVQIWFYPVLDFNIPVLLPYSQKNIIYYFLNKLFIRNKSIGIQTQWAEICFIQNLECLFIAFPDPSPKMLI